MPSMGRNLALPRRWGEAMRRIGPLTRQIAIIQGHPDPAGHHFCHALADAYAKGAEAAGHQVQRIEIAHLDFPLLRTHERGIQQRFAASRFCSLPKTPSRMPITS